MNGESWKCDGEYDYLSDHAFMSSYYNTAWSSLRNSKKERNQEEKKTYKNTFSLPCEKLSNMLNIKLEYIHICINNDLNYMCFSLFVVGSDFFHGLFSIKSLGESEFLEFSIDLQKVILFSVRPKYKYL